MANSNIKVKFICAREILDSKGMPTVEAELKTNSGNFLASVPSGISTGKYEAAELRDSDGKGVKKAIENIEKIISPALENEDLNDQKRIDEILITLDGTKNKSRLGANAILPVSIAVCRAIASSKAISLYQYISEISADPIIKLPKPSFNMIEGGKHAKSGLAFQEFMAVPQSESFKENLEGGKKVYKKLGEILNNKFPKVELSAEGAFASPEKEISKVLDLLSEAIEDVGKKDMVKIAIDAAASEFCENGNYKIGDEIISGKELVELYKGLAKIYPIISVEDPFFEEDFDNFSQLKKETNDKFIILGDDLTATNIERIKLAKEKDACSGLILKPNQIGSVTEAIDAAKLAKSFGWKIMVANRAGETEDSFIADLAVGISADFIKSGAPFPKERMAKYERLAEIEKEVVGASGM
ncbi:MAG: enolase [Candidatus Pacebacteria bacterium]|nr:enolase [Candidatus Paceibacterota bacterium]